MLLLAARWTLGASHQHRGGIFFTDTETLFNLKRRFPWPILSTWWLNALKLLSAMSSFSLQRRWPKALNIVTLKLLGLLFQVRDVILDLSLSPNRQPPIVCIDESQVTFWEQIHLEDISPARLQNVSQPCFTSSCIQFQEFGSNLQLPVLMRNDIVCLNAAVLPWQIWKCVARNTKWLLVVHPDYSYQYYEKCVLKCSSIAVTNLKLCGEKYEMTPGRKSMCWIGRNPFGQTGGARVDKLVGQLNQL